MHTLETARQRILELTMLEEGWYDGQRGIPMQKKHADYVLGVVEAMNAAGMTSLPYIFPIETGGVALEWSHAHLDIEFEDEDGITYFLLGSGDKPHSFGSLQGVDDTISLLQDVLSD